MLTPFMTLDETRDYLKRSKSRMRTSQYKCGLNFPGGWDPERAMILWQKDMAKWAKELRQHANKYRRK